ncbi:polysaccharide biosynthesis protein [Roseomonas nepalensis]|uniref:Polysaccharide biosynthesis protein n=1 Tax=Muricoccus nepalensis TaxID=1854500 RepID=A0A502FJB6_9PROT|nr:oligosaccharide flippase family protein [Roseomonas nepalensis]TPG49580.1 polysaccharide biosynthesis protein [Roseomonas nepalensis]
MTSVRRGLAWMAFSQVSLFVLQFVVSILVARLLSPYEMGIFAVAVSTVGLLATIRSFGLGSFLIRVEEWSRPLVSTVFTINAVLALTLSAAVTGLSVLGSAALEEVGVRQVLLIMAIVPLISIFDFLPTAGLERRGEFKTIALINLVRYTTANLLTLALAYAGHGFMSLAYGQVASAVMAAVMSNGFGWQYAHLRLGLSEHRTVLRFGLQVLTTSGLGGFSGRLSDLILAKMLGLSALGLYSRAGSLTGVLWENLHAIVLRVLLVDFAEQRRQGKSLRDSYLHTMRLLTAAFWPPLIGMAVISGPLVLLLFGDAWYGVVLPLSFLAVSTAVVIPIIMAWDIFILCSETGKQVRIEVMRALVSFGLLFAGCLFDLDAVAALAILSSVFSLLIYQPHLERMTDTTWSDYMPIYGQGSLLTAAAVLPAAGVMTIYGWSANTPLLPLLAGITVGVLAWMWTLRVLHHPLYQEAFRILSGVRRATVRSDIGAVGGTDPSELTLGVPSSDRGRFG